MSGEPLAENALLIAGHVLETAQIRYSPAGLPIARFSLEHRSRQMEAGIEREARCRIPVLACGEALVRRVRLLSAGAPVRVEGFLARSDHRQGEARLVLHTQHIELLENP
ncbi:MAG: primosomal replication protein N [Gammaproteobacteria bacterium]|nr:primosomal replication protein N [Gammaproteobacteria bacterium]MCP5458797.1 primosomal replication protein N [Gammaproteobacteria bacterium]